MNNRLLIRSLAAMLLAMSPIARPTQAAVDPEKVDRAIDAGVKFLLAEWRDETHWDHVGPGFQGQTKGGPTALAAYALLSAGVKPMAEPKLEAAIKYLRTCDSKGIYGVGMRCAVWEMLPPTPENRDALRRDLQIIFSSARTVMPARGMFGYEGPPTSTEYDHSISQFAVLGAWSAERAGFEVTPRFWEVVEAAWRGHQYADGSYSYVHAAGTPANPASAKPTVSMTAAGVATLYITTSYTRRPSGTGNAPEDRSIEKGLGWIAEHLDSVMTQEGQFQNEFWQYYAMFGVQRVGAASGLKFVGVHDWYAKLATYILAEQQPAGNWPPHHISAVNNTSFAVLFLAQARAPVVINKLRYASAAKPGASKPDTAVWNARPGEIAGFTHWLSKTMERRLNWQLTDLRLASNAQLHDAPVCYLSGQGDTDFTPEDIDKLRQYISTGGLLVIHVDRGELRFKKSALDLCNRLYPIYEARPLAATHPIVKSIASNDKTPGKVSLMGVSNGVRELVVVITQGDPAAAWQNRETKKDYAFATMASIAAYACPVSQLTTKGRTHLLEPSTATTARTARVARIKYTGNWDPEPAGWARLATMMQTKDALALKPEPVDIETTDLKGPGEPDGFIIAHLTGTDAFKLSAAARGRLKKFTEAGGLILVDAAGGSTAFADGVESELSQVFGATTVPAAEQLLVLKNSPEPVQFAFREYVAQLTLDKSALKLRQLNVNDRPVVIWSPIDLSAGLVGSPSSGIVGFAPETAAEICRRVVLKQLETNP